MPQRRRYWEAQVISLSTLEWGQTSDPTGFQKEPKWQRVWRNLAVEANGTKVIFLWESELHKNCGFPVEGFSRPCCHGWITSWSCRKVRSMWLVSGAIGTWWEIGTFAWDVCFSDCWTWGPAHHQEGAADGLPLSSQEKYWPHQGACQQQKKWWVVEWKHRSESGRRGLVDLERCWLKWSMSNGTAQKRTRKINRRGVLLWQWRSGWISQRKSDEGWGFHVASKCRYASTGERKCM